MKAAVLNTYDKHNIHLEIREVAAPMPKDNEVLVHRILQQHGPAPGIHIYAPQSAGRLPGF